MTANTSDMTETTYTTSFQTSTVQVVTVNVATGGGKTASMWAPLYSDWVIASGSVQVDLEDMAQAGRSAAEARLIALRSAAALRAPTNHEPEAESEIQARSDVTRALYLVQTETIVPDAFNDSETSETSE